MKTLVPGHKYELPNFEKKDEPGQILQFIHREHSMTDTRGLITIMDGTSTEEVLQVLIDHMQFLQSKIPCKENSIVIQKLVECQMWLEKRTSDRVKRNVEGTNVS